MSIYEELVCDKGHFSFNDSIHIFQDSEVSLRSAHDYFFLLGIFFFLSFFLFFFFGM